jgi:hypothetical protein
MEKKSLAHQAESTEILQELHLWFLVSGLLWMMTIILLAVYTYYYSCKSLPQPPSIASVSLHLPSEPSFNPFSMFMDLSDTLPDPIAFRTISFSRNRIECTGITCNPEAWHLWFNGLEKKYSAKAALSSFFETSIKNEYYFSVSLSF